MSMGLFIPGGPRIGTAVKTQPRIIFRQADWFSSLGGGKVIDGTKSRDPDNTGDTNVLRVGLLMGKVTATGKYATSVLGLNKTAYTSGGTTITTQTPAEAAEIVRRIGATGNLTYVGPPSANGTNATIASIAYSAVNVTTGAITVSTLGANLVAGAFITDTDGTAVPTTFISDWDNNGTGLIVTDIDNVTSLDQPFPLLPIAGVVISANLIPWPSDTSLQTYVRTSLSSLVGGKYVFDDQF